MNVWNFYFCTMNHADKVGIKSCEELVDAHILGDKKITKVSIQLDEAILRNEAYEICLKTHFPKGFRYTDRLSTFVQGKYEAVPKPLIYPSLFTTVTEQVHGVVYEPKIFGDTAKAEATFDAMMKEAGAAVIHHDEFTMTAEDSNGYRVSLHRQVQLQG
jgi:hypothetical protein